MQSQGIEAHEGAKYLRQIHSAYMREPGIAACVMVDVYCVLVAFDVDCPAVAHAVKKLLTAGQRGKGSALDDLIGAQAAISRAIELERLRAAKELAAIREAKEHEQEKATH
jgi:hypothetical protein